ncbi:hypothetical protein DID75_01180 [Candidatus Marinamargulisbacteria bacterium SCGC AG-410-N11]|nr:hypothetical protein DID75_01180 [Candidatus Marinamargulisbacteria bacterium SCGC AG-410-N11]
MKFNQLFAKIRSEKGLTKSFLANKLNVSLTVIVDYEKGKIKPTLEKGNKLSNIFSLSNHDRLHFLNSLLSERLSESDRPFVTIADHDQQTSHTIPLVKTPSSKHDTLIIQDHIPYFTKTTHNRIYAIKFQGPHPITEYGIQVNDTLIIDEEQPVTNHCLVLVCIDKTTYIRKVDFFPEGNILFQPCNSTESSIILNSINTPNKFQIIGKLILSLKHFS